MHLLQLTRTNYQQSPCTVPVNQKRYFLVPVNARSPKWVGGRQKSAIFAIFALHETNKKRSPPSWIRQNTPRIYLKTYFGLTSFVFVVGLCIKTVNFNSVFISTVFGFDPHSVIDAVIRWAKAGKLIIHSCCCDVDYKTVRAHNSIYRNGVI